MGNVEVSDGLSVACSTVSPGHAFAQMPLDTLGSNVEPLESRYVVRTHANPQVTTSMSSTL